MAFLESGCNLESIKTGFGDIGPKLTKLEPFEDFFKSLKKCKFEKLIVVKGLTSHFLQQSDW